MPKPLSISATKPTDQRDQFRVAASNAGRTLAIRRLRPSGPDGRKWTGVVFAGKRAWVGEPVVLPNGKTGWIKKAMANQACVRTCETDSVAEPIHEYLPTSELRPYRLPEAVLLGSLKRGVKERPSPAKAAACKSNGTLPSRPGHRPRGRPRKRLPDPGRVDALTGALRALLGQAASGGSKARRQEPC